MAVEEKGVVVGNAEGRAVVRAEAGSQCSGCGAAKYCRGGTSEGEKIIEAENPVGAVHGDRVVIAVPAGALLRASFRVYVRRICRDGIYRGRYVYKQ